MTRRHGGGGGQGSLRSCCSRHGRGWRSRPHRRYTSADELSAFGYSEPFVPPAANSGEPSSLLRPGGASGDSRFLGWMMLFGFPENERRNNGTGLPSWSWLRQPLRWWWRREGVEIAAEPIEEPDVAGRWCFARLDASLIFEPSDGCRKIGLYVAASDPSLPPAAAILATASYYFIISRFVCLILPRWYLDHVIHRKLVSHLRCRLQDLGDRSLFATAAADTQGVRLDLGGFHSGSAHYPTNGRGRKIPPVARPRTVLGRRRTRQLSQFGCECLRKCPREQRSH